MKNIFFSACLLLLVNTHASAQQNTLMIYGNGSYDNMDYTPNGNNGSYPATSLSLIGWSANAGVGLVTSDHFMLGLQGGYGKQDVANYYISPYPVYGTVRIANWNAGVFGRYTSSLSKRFFVYAQLFAGKTGVDSRVLPEGNGNVTPPYYSPAPSGMPDGNGVVVNLFPGAGMNLICGYGINVNIGGISYTSYNSTTSSSDLHHFNVTLGRQFIFGIHKILGWQKLNSTTPPTTPPAPAAN